MNRFNHQRILTSSSLYKDFNASVDLAFIFNGVLVFGLLYNTKRYLKSLILAYYLPNDLLHQNMYSS